MLKMRCEVVINPRKRVTILGLCVCVCLFKWFLPFRTIKCPKRDVIRISALWEDVNVSFQSYGYFLFIQYLKSAILLHHAQRATPI